MINKILFVGFITTIISTIAIASESADKITEYSKTGEVLKVYSKSAANNGQPGQTLSKKLCLDNQTIKSVGTDGTVTCFDEASGSITSYINLDLRSAKSYSELKTFKLQANNTPCSNGSTLIKIDSNGRFECDPL